jgi:hypothetical protein
VYALGAVAYYLLTGSPVFAGSTVMEICLKHVREAPEPPAVRLGEPVTPALEALILRCLSKARADRPGDAGALLRELDRCPAAGSWTPDDAAAWWAAGGPDAARPAKTVDLTRTTDQVALDVTGAFDNAGLGANP